MIASSFAAQAGLVINPTFDSSITSDPNAATIESTINSAIQVYETTFADPITVSITFKAMNSGLGQSLTYGGTFPYSSFLAALTADATSANDFTALAHLPSGANNPVTGNSSVVLTTANFRALGINAQPPSGQPDGTVSLNLSLMNLSRSSINNSKYDLMAVASHEIDEVLGLHSAMTVTNGAPAPTGAVFPLDLFRYDQNGNRSFNSATGSQAYFSLDGSTPLARFNQDDRGDRGDWFSPGSQTPQVQDAFGTPGATPNLGVERVALDVSGYDLASVPETGAFGVAAVMALTAFSVARRGLSNKRR